MDKFSELIKECNEITLFHKEVISNILTKEYKLNPEIVLNFLSKNLMELGQLEEDSLFDGIENIRQTYSKYVTAIIEDRFQNLKRILNFYHDADCPYKHDFFIKGVIKSLTDLITLIPQLSQDEINSIGFFEKRCEFPTADDETTFGDTHFSKYYFLNLNILVDFRANKCKSFENITLTYE